MKQQILPRLLYIGDVPVESTVAGSALIYRLLQDYPPEKLCIIESNIAVSGPDKRLPEVTYKTIKIGIKRLLYSRFVNLYKTYLTLTAKWQCSQINKIIGSFQPEAILTVAHGFSWLTAVEFSKRNRLPLHLIIHDDWLSFMPTIPKLKNTAEQLFANAYKQAQSRLCVSPYMMEFYQQKYGIRGTILYPARAKNAITYDEPPEKLGHKTNSLVFAYAGSIHTNAYAQSIVELASVIENIGGHLLIYSPLDQSSIKGYGLDQPHITTSSLIPSSELIDTLRKEADILFVPMSFESEDRRHMELSFPSKLTDYTAVGLPLLIWGPSYCSAVRWAKDNPMVAEVIETQEIDALAHAIAQLASSSKYRQTLANNALKKGEQYFSYTQSVRLFYETIALDKNANFHSSSTSATVKVN